MNEVHGMYERIVRYALLVLYVTARDHMRILCIAKCHAIVMGREKLDATRNEHLPIFILFTHDDAHVIQLLCIHLVFVSYVHTLL